MDEYLMREMMRNRQHMDKHDMMRRFQEFMEQENYRPYSKFEDYFNRENLRREMDSMDMEEREFFNKMRDYHAGSKGEHFNTSYAKYEVSQMFHFLNGRKRQGEKFSMDKAKEVHEHYASVLSPEITVADVYVAINSQFHDYYDLFRSWFGDAGVEQKIIDSAIVFWFKDADCEGNNKVWKYFKKED